MNLHTSALQRAKYLLVRWQYYENNINILDRYAKKNSIKFFKGLKQLETKEVKLLAERYYKSDEKIGFNKKIGEYTTVKPVPYENIARLVNESKQTIQEELKRIEKKLGYFIIEQSIQEDEHDSS